MTARKTKQTDEQPKTEAAPVIQNLGTPAPAEQKTPRITKYPDGTERRDN